MVYFININKNLRNTSAGLNGLLKDVNGVNGMPISIAPGFPDLEDQFNQMGITHIRLHDAFGIGDIDDGFQANRSSNQNQLMLNVPSAKQASGKKFIAEFANKRTIFPFAAAGMKANDLTLACKNVNFKPTDYSIKRIMDNNTALNPTNIQREVMIRVGRTLDGGYEIPANFDIYASMAKQLAERYSANYKAIGLPRKVAYWEIWNEPDLTFFWNNNNPQIYYEFYSKVAKAIKSADPSAKVGGCGVANGYNPGGPYLDGLLNYCKNTNTPIDFLSWHYYGNITADPQNVIDIGNAIQLTCNNYGYSNIESICTEWNSSPFGTINTYSNVQSATNAAYITSSLMCMQYCKVDKAYYYRGDGSSFGLFNDQTNPSNPAYKNFCTCSAQGFHLFNKMFETPYILTQDNLFNTGLITLAGENAGGDKINILAANYKVDYTFVNGNVKRTRYQQYYLDSNRTTNQLNDSWSKEHWFGGQDPNTLTFDNLVTQRNPVGQIPINGSLRSRSRSYTQSNTGIGLNINNIPSTYQGYKLTAYRIKEGGRLDRMLPEKVTASINISMANGVLKITDTGATLSTVTLYSLELIDNNNNNNSNTQGQIEHTVTIPRGTRIPLSAALPPGYVFTANKSYEIDMITPINQFRNCTSGTTYNKAKQTCDYLGKGSITYRCTTQPTNNQLVVFTTSIGGILYNNPQLVGTSYFQCDYNKDLIVTYKLKPL